MSPQKKFFNVIICVIIVIYLIKYSIGIFMVWYIFGSIDHGKNNNY